jgi:predicted metal-dependent hydrolase
MPTITDKEFGQITIRRSSRSTHVKISVAPNGTLRASLPIYAPVFMLKRLINSSRAELKDMLEKQTPTYEFTSGMVIGKSHTLIISQSNKSSTTVTRTKQRITVSLGQHDTIQSAPVIEKIRACITAALRIEAKSYLPKRLAYLAKDMDCSYERVRFSHASGRWGSCSSTGTISLNIALMKLPHELIDYVLIHELCHTKQMNHSDAFWNLVASEDPSYKLHRKSLKLHTPSI